MERSSGCRAASSSGSSSRAMPSPCPATRKQGRGCAVGGQDTGSSSPAGLAWTGSRTGPLTRASYCVGSRGLVKKANKLLLVVHT